MYSWYIRFIFNCSRVVLIKKERLQHFELQTTLEMTYLAFAIMNNFFECDLHRNVVKMKTELLKAKRTHMC